MDFVMPDKWQDWTAVEFVGEGSYGEVYKATNESGDVCAIKVIEIPKTKEEADSIRREYGNEETVKSFYTNLAEDYEKEIQLLNSLKDAANIVRIYDYFREPNGVGWKMYIRMEYLQSFTEYCDVNEIDESRAIEFASDICNALIQCEKLGIVHRDLKPDNILVDAGGTLKLCDFGLARTMDASKGSYSIKGTFSYMAPEIYLGRKYSSQVDIYSLGIILYRLMNRGREPFIPVDKKLIYYKDKETALSKRMDGEKMPEPADATPGFAAIILKACAYSTEDRYKRAADMKKDLRMLQGGDYRKSLMTNSQMRRLMIIVAAAILAAGAVFGYARTQVFTGIHASLSSDGVLKVYGDEAVTKSVVSNYQETAKAIVIKDGVTGIGESAFEGFENVESVEIPGSVESIGSGAFAACTSIKKMDLSSLHMNEIEDGAFALCTSLEEFSFPEGVTKVTAGLLQSCSSLRRVDFGDNDITLVDETAFQYCDGLESIVLPGAVESVGDSAFEGCTELQSAALGGNTTAIGDNAFNSCEQLEEVSGLENVKSFGGDVFTDSKYEKTMADRDGFLIINGVLLRYLGGKSEVRIPDEVKVIGDSAFAMSNVEKVVIGAGVTKIDDLAFYNCSMLKEVVLEEGSRLEEIGESAFEETPLLNSAEVLKIGDFEIKGEQ